MQTLLDEQVGNLIDESMIEAKRTSFWQDADRMDDKELFRKYYPLKLLSVRLRFWVKVLLYRTGLIRARKQ